MDFLQDWLFWAALGGLLYNFAKLLRDYHQGKKFKWWMWVLEIGLLAVIVFAISYGTFARYRRDQRRETEANNRYNASEASADAREKTLENLIRQKDQTIEAQKKIIQADSKPNIVMEETGDGENPHMERINEDSVRITAYFENIGSASAQSFHSIYHFITSDKDENPSDYLAKKMDNLGPDFKFLPAGLNRGIRQTGKIRLSSNIGKNILVWVCYCYKDSLNRQYGPFQKMFEWYNDMSEIGSAYANEKAFSKAKAYFRDCKLNCVRG